MTVKEDLLTVMTLVERTRGEDIFAAFRNFVDKNDIPLQKLSSVTTDGAPAMVGRTNGFVQLCKNNDKFPRFFNYHCIIHQQALCAKILKFDHVMKTIVKIINSIHAKALQRRLFRSLLEERTTSAYRS